MWKVLLGFICHRCVLLVVALIAVNLSLNANSENPGSFPRIKPLSLLMAELGNRVRLVPEIETAERVAGVSASEVFSHTRHPFFWCVRWWTELTGMGPMLSVVLLSNFFFLIFLFETFLLLASMVLLETATWGVLLVLVFPSSYEISMGSSFSLTACLLAIALRRALENQWFITGCALALAALGDWAAMGWLPLLLGVFWYYQRHFQLAQVVKRKVFFLAPLIIAVILRWDWYSHVLTSFSGSALSSLVNSPLVWLSDLSSWQRFSFSGPVFSLAVFMVGAILCLASYSTWLNRLVPFYLILVVLSYSSVSTLSVRLLLAGMALSGIAYVSSGTLARLLCAVFTFLAGAEIVRVFSAA